MRKRLADERAVAGTPATPAASIHLQEKSSIVSKNVAVFVDVANLYYSARGQEVDVDYVALLKAATGAT